MCHFLNFYKSLLCICPPFFVFSRSLHKLLMMDGMMMKWMKIFKKILVTFKLVSVFGAFGWILVQQLFKIEFHQTCRNVVATPNNLYSDDAYSTYRRDTLCRWRQYVLLSISVAIRGHGSAIYSFYTFSHELNIILKIFICFLLINLNLNLPKIYFRAKKKHLFD